MCLLLFFFTLNITTVRFSHYVHGYRVWTAAESNYSLVDKLFTLPPEQTTLKRTLLCLVMHEDKSVLSGHTRRLGYTLYTRLKDTSSCSILVDIAKLISKVIVPIYILLKDVFTVQLSSSGNAFSCPLPIFPIKLLLFPHSLLRISWYVLEPRPRSLSSISNILQTSVSVLCLLFSLP